MFNFNNTYYDSRATTVLNEYTYLTLSDIAKKYNEPHRHFHTLQHLKFIFNYFLNTNSFLIDNDIIVLTILFHDIIYDPQSSINEKKSANFLEEHWKHTDNIEYLKDTKECIIDTKYRRNTTVLCEYFNEADMSILDTSFETLVPYENQIRQEYNFVPYSIYKQKRINFIKSTSNYTKNSTELNELIIYIEEYSVNK